VESRKLSHLSHPLMHCYLIVTWAPDKVKDAHMASEQFPNRQLRTNGNQAFILWARTFLDGLILELNSRTQITGNGVHKEPCVLLWLATGTTRNFSASSQPAQSKLLLRASHNMSRCIPRCGRGYPRGWPPEGTLPNAPLSLCNYMCL
jgi:hypothetical protein